MVTKGVEFGLTVMALVPVGFTYALVAVFHGHLEVAAPWFLGSVLLFCVSYGLWRCATSRVERMRFRVTAVEVADDRSVAFLLVYLLPLISGYANGPPIWKVWLPIALVMCVAVLTSFSYHFNPMLGILGWHFFKTTTPEGVTYVMITKRPLHSIGESMIVGQLTEYVVVDLGE